ncbi:hypothetical protein PCCS19_35360 [Paenibacillus sp. CCS19]|uniref:hypothetical protein n=1 Tax=Paenibacillus sp. CCS19 TaxID=3158387 RepID=UPI002562DE3A|nr:hypothetical protein [Paenibacillus cellulosilyticus]GMK40480.1 hypothetical protein PCCS19_35360 [Paenibacillus cellulosilyticus]
MTMRRNYGVIAVAAGIIWLLIQAQSTDGRSYANGGSIITYFWPTLFILPLGIFFHVAYLYKRSKPAAGLLIPGGVLLVTGLTCQAGMLFDAWATVWPGFLLAVAFGLFEFYLFGYRGFWLLLPVFVLGGAAVIFFALLSITAIAPFNGLQGLTASLIVLGGLMVLLQKSTGDEDDYRKY